MFEFMDARFEFREILEARFESIECFNDVGEALIVVLAPDAGLHPAVKSPQRENQQPKFHGASGLDSVGQVFDRESLQRVNTPVEEYWSWDSQDRNGEQEGGTRFARRKPRSLDFLHSCRALGIVQSLHSFARSV